MIRRPPRSTLSSSSAASDVYKRQGYPDAWQPTVGGPGTYGTSYIKWDVEFDTAGVPYVFSLLDLSAVDVDGDNARVRELSGIVGSNMNYSLSLIHISEPTRRTPISYAVFCL